MNPAIALAPTPEEDVAPSQVEYMKSLRTGLRVLLCFENSKRDQGVTDIALRTGLAKSQVSKIMSALVDSGLVEQDPATRTYHIGQRTYLLGSRYTTFDTLCQAATPVMRELLNSTGHSIRLSVPHRDQSLYLIGLEGPQFIDTGWHSGNCVAMGAASAGRILLAFMEPAERERILAIPVPALTPDTVTDPAQIARIVEQARETGYVVQRNETSIGLGVISVPLFKENQKVVGALGAAFPSHFLAAKEERELIRSLHASARSISQRLGCAVYPVRALPPAD